MQFFYFLTPPSPPPSLSFVVQRFGNNEDEEPPSEDEGGGDVFGTALAVKKEVPLPAVKQKKPQLPPAPKLWSVTERSRLERMLMLWGYSDWEIISEAFPRRTIQDLKAATKQLITRCLRAPGLETDLVADIKALVEVDASREGDQILGFKLDEVSNETPFPDATEKQVKGKKVVGLSHSFFFFKLTLSFLAA